MPYTTDQIIAYLAKQRSIRKDIAPFDEATSRPVSEWILLLQNELNMTLGAHVHDLREDHSALAHISKLAQLAIKAMEQHGVQ